MRLEDYVGLDHFLADEFAQPEKMVVDFVKRLDVARHLAGVPFKLTSTFRVDDTPDQLDSTHEIGAGADIACPKNAHCLERSAIIRGLLDAGFTRIGIYDRHIHADLGDRINIDKWPANCIWWGISK